MPDIAPWITFRPEIKVLDCSIRDGGLMNNHQFDDQTVRRVYETCVAAGIDYFEFGYKASKRLYAPSKFGAWKFCDEDDIRRIVGENKADIKLCAMADAERTDYHTDILPSDQSVLDVIRVATYINQIPTAVDMIKDAKDKGYEVTVNLMAVSAVQDLELEQALETFCQTPVDTVYLVDSWGSLYHEQIRILTQHYLKHLKPCGKELGIHTHNNQQLAYANTIEAIIQGANRIDATLMGIGRGAGNCPMELLIGFLRNPKFDLRPILQCIQDVIIPLTKTMEWGYTIPYAISGQLNQHPRDAMAILESPDRDKIVEFYDRSLTAE